MGPTFSVSNSSFAFQTVRRPVESSSRSIPGRINPSDLPQANHKSFSWRLATFGLFMTPPRTNSRFATDALPAHPCELFEMRQTDRERLATTHSSIAMLRLTSLFGKCIPNTPPHVDEPERTSNRLSRNQVPEQVCRFESGQSNADLQTPR